MKRDAKAEAHRWLAQAEEEYKDAELLMRARRYLFSLGIPNSQHGNL
jgi:hypothetical protein